MQAGQCLTHLPGVPPLSMAQSASDSQSRQRLVTAQYGFPLSSTTQKPLGLLGQGGGVVRQAFCRIVQPAAPLVGRHFPFRHVPEQQPPFGPAPHGFPFRRHARAGSTPIRSPSPAAPALIASRTSPRRDRARLAIVLTQSSNPSPSMGGAFPMGTNTSREPPPGVPGGECELIAGPKAGFAGSYYLQIVRPRSARRYQLDGTKSVKSSAIEIADVAEK